MTRVIVEADALIFAQAGSAETGIEHAPSRQSSPSAQVTPQAPQCAGRCWYQRKHPGTRLRWGRDRRRLDGWVTP